MKMYGNPILMDAWLFGFFILEHMAGQILGKKKKKTLSEDVVGKEKAVEKEF